MRRLLGPLHIRPEVDGVPGWRDGFAVAEGYGVRARRGWIGEIELIENFVRELRRQFCEFFERSAAGLSQRLI
jgi:hypothetical protein